MKFKEEEAELLLRRSPTVGVGWGGTYPPGKYESKHDAKNDNIRLFSGIISVGQLSICVSRFHIRVHNGRWKMSLEYLYDLFESILIGNE